jgi:DNA-binding CsgD family transcriptional regulator
VTKNGERQHIPAETFSKVIGAIYDCALDPSRWQETVGMIGELCRSEYCVLGVLDTRNERIELTFQVGFDESTYELMKRYIGALQLLPVGAVATRAMLLADDQEFLERRYLRGSGKPQGISDAIGFRVLDTGRRISALAAHRVDPQEPYGDAEVRLLTLLAPHICRSVAISDALNLETIRSEGLETTLDALACGVYLTDRHSRIVYFNRAAERQVRTSRALRIGNNRLIPVDPVARAALAKAINEATADTTAGGITLALPGDEDIGLIATILPLSPGKRRDLGGTFAATAAIFVQDPIAVPPLPGDAFAKLYGLTGSELRVLLAISPGISVREAADKLGISEATAKTHLQHIHAKTGTSKQTELMHLLMGSAPPVQAVPKPQLSSAKAKVARTIPN